MRESSRDTSRREMIRLRSEATSYLSSFLDMIFWFPPKWRKHFDTDFSFRRKEWDHRDFEWDPINSDGKFMLKSFFRVLKNTTKGHRSSREHLDGLKMALNFPVEVISYRKESGGLRLHRRVGDWRIAGELLWEYLELVSRVGPVHAVCKRKHCSKLFVPTRGQKFCSEYCRQEHWSYPNQAAYFMRKQQEHRMSAGAQLKRRRKQTKKRGAVRVANRMKRE